jgi:hypothetical protein
MTDKTRKPHVRDRYGYLDEQRDKENAEIDARYPINPSDPKEVQEKNRIKREVAKMDP